MAMSDDGGAKGITDRLARRWAELMSGGVSGEAPTEDIAAAAASTAPVVWLIGKVQSGKSSIVQAITGATEAEVGTGFRPCTRTARVFDFPAEAPVIRFLDTRGLGETGYRPDDDLAFAEGHAHLLLVVMRALDHQQDEVVDAVIAVRRRRPDWPIVVAQTCLHEAYPQGDGHVVPYPFAVGAGEATDSRLPEALTRSLAHQRQAFLARVGGRAPVLFAPIDLTQPGDALEPRHYGLDALLATISEAAPASIAATFNQIAAVSADRSLARDHPLILGYAAAAGAADLVPLAGAVAVPGVQAKLLHALAVRHSVDWDRRAIAEFGACLGAGILGRLAARFGIRQLVKLVPVYGQTIGAAAAAATSFATTYALGRAAIEFLRRRRRGESNPAAVAAAYRDGLAKAFAMARERGLQPETASSSTGSGADGQR
ncbi:MAG: GTPase domain-containing protein [Hyphomicrobiaceae bacterium]|nr:GTPase domain-containing protein [Hyphomicrobiaceae bacterium]